MPQIIEKLVRDNVKALKAYASARSTMKAGDDIALLDAAENPYSPFDNDDNSVLKNMNRYPEPQPAALLSGLSSLYGVNTQNIISTRGSEEAIRLLIQLFCDPQKDAMITCPPTFGMYPIEAQIHDIENIQIPRLGEFHNELDMEAIKSAAKDPEKHAKIIMICNPGNPASTALPVTQVTELIEALTDDCMIVIDEAYIEFAGHPSFTAMIEDNPHLIVLRTLSKSYGLAGLRCGSILAHEDVIGYLKKIIAAYPVPRSTAEIAVSALQKEQLKYMQDKQTEIISERNRMIQQIKESTPNVSVFPSSSNYLCVEVQDVNKAVQTFLNQNVLIRDRSSAIKNAINIAVGNKEQNDKTIEILKSL